MDGWMIGRKKKGRKEGRKRERESERERERDQVFPDSLAKRLSPRYKVFFIQNKKNMHL